MAYDWMRNQTQGFGPTSEPLDGPYRGAAHFNKGFDYGVPRGTPIDSHVTGRVVSISDDPNDSSGWGKYVWVQTADGAIHQWGHLDSVSVNVGDSVTQGQVVGLSGNTGQSTGPHVSYDVQKDGEYVDPAPFVSGGGAMEPGDGGPTELDKVRQVLNDLLENPPEKTGDQAEDSYNQEAWTQSLTSLVALRKSLESGDGKANQRQQDFSNKIAALSASLAYDNTNIDRATADIDRFLTGKAESAKRAGLIADSKKELRMYGAPKGKTSFSYRDLGAGFEGLAGAMGWDPGGAAISYPGQVWLDPEGDMARFDATMGVGGQIPSVPQLTTAGSTGQIQPPAAWAPPKNPLASGLGSGGAMPGAFDAAAAASPTGNAVPAAWDARTPEPAFRPDWSTFLTPENRPISEDPAIQNWRLAQGRGY